MVLIVTTPLAIGSGMVLWVAWEIGAFDGLMPPCCDERWKELLSLIGFATVCIFWIAALAIAIRMFWKHNRVEKVQEK